MTMNPETLERLTILNTVLLGLNTLMIASVIVSGGGEPPPEPMIPDPGELRSGSQSTQLRDGYGLGRRHSAEPGGGDMGKGGIEGGASLIETYLVSTIGPLRVAATDLQRDIALPSVAQVAACVDSDAMDGAACSDVLKLLQAGYDAVGMPFPAAPDTKPQGPANPGGGVLQVYFDAVQARLVTAVEKAGEDPKDVLPTPSQVAAAVATGDPRSAASTAVVDHLREQYGEYGLRFTEPFVTADASAQAGSGSMETQRELLASYLDHMIQRLRRAAEDQGKDTQRLVPPADLVAAAVASGDLDSADTAIVLDALRSSYKTLDLDFTEPPH